MRVLSSRLGRLAGITGNGVHAYLGIPYAAAPVGALRYASPRPASPWTGELQATRYAPAPLQTLRPQSGWIYDTPERTDEDCLYLNVWTPSASNAGGYPVLVWIHGGAWRTGHGGVHATDGAELARAGQVVVVTVNSRQGALGWLCHPELSDPDTGAYANWSLQDQIAAFHWVRDNIADFGGDPANITAVGQSAGGQSIAVMAQTQRDYRLFDKAICQSPALFGSPRFMDRDSAIWYAEVLASRLNCEVAGLRGVAADLLHETEVPLLADSAVLKRLGGFRYLPVDDGQIIPAWPYGKGMGDIPLIVGWTRNETNFFFNLRAPDGKPLADEIPGDEVALRNALAAFTGQYYPFGQGPTMEELIGHYRSLSNGTPSLKQLWLDITTDVDIRGYSVWLADAHASGGAPTYAYEFAHPVAAPCEGSPHTAEIPFVFGTYRHPFLAPKFGTTAAEAVVSRAFITAWSSFARNGVPAFADGSAWPAYKGSRPAVCVFGSTEQPTRIERAPRFAELDIWPRFAAIRRGLPVPPYA